MKKVTVHLSDENASGIKYLSEETGASQRYLINKAIANYLAARKVTT